MIREDKPPKPSARNRPEPAAGRRDLRRRMIGREMDWVVMQALEKDRSRRYQTANGFGLDIRRILDDEPVSASPPSATYRFTKFAKRHRAAAVWGIVFLAFVLSAAIGMTALYFDAKDKAQVAREQTAAAEIERTKAVEAGKSRSTGPGKRGCRRPRPCAGAANRNAASWPSTPFVKPPP